jgi:hypothetical protein
MIRLAILEAFKGLRRVEIELGRLGVLVGPNASGKSSVLEGIYYATQLVRKQPPEIFSGPRDLRLLLSRGAQGPVRLGVYDAPVHWVAHVAFEGWPGVGDEAVESADITNAESSSTRLSYGVTGATVDEPNPTQIGNLSDASRNHLAQEFGRAVFLRLDAEQLAAPSYSDRPVPRVEYNGYGLPSVLAHMKLNEPDGFERLVDALRRIVPSVRDIRFARSKVRRTETQLHTAGGKTFPLETEREFWGDAVLFDTSSGSRIAAHLVSEGTLLAAGLLAVVMGPQRPRIVLLDDIDRALHPKAQAELVGVLRRMLEQYDDLQLLATSHSPYLLDSLGFDEVILTLLNDDGEVITARLDEHPEVDRWKDVMTPGEFWSSVGEDWLKELEREGSHP